MRRSRTTASYSGWEPMATAVRKTSSDASYRYSAVSRKASVRSTALAATLRDLVDAAHGAQLGAERDDRLEPPRAAAVRLRRAVQIADDPALAAVEEVAAGEERERPGPRRRASAPRAGRRASRPASTKRPTASSAASSAVAQTSSTHERPRACALAAVQGHDADREEERHEGADEVQIADDLDGPVSLRSGSPGLTLSLNVYRHTSTPREPALCGRRGAPADAQQAEQLADVRLGLLRARVVRVRRLGLEDAAEAQLAARPRA